MLSPEYADGHSAYQDSGNLAVCSTCCYCNIAAYCVVPSRRGKGVENSTHDAQSHCNDGSKEFPACHLAFWFLLFIHHSIDLQLLAPLLSVFRDGGHVLAGAQKRGELESKRESLK